MCAHGRVCIQIVPYWNQPHRQSLAGLSFTHYRKLKETSMKRKNALPSLCYTDNHLCLAAQHTAGKSTCSMHYDEERRGVSERGCCRIRWEGEVSKSRGCSEPARYTRRRKPANTCLHTHKHYVTSGAGYTENHFTTSSLSWQYSAKQHHDRAAAATVSAVLSTT